MKFYILVVFFLLSSVTLAEPCKYGKTIMGSTFSDVKDKTETIKEKTYKANQQHFIKGERKIQILAATEALSLKDAFQGADQGEIYRMDFVSAQLPADFYTTMFYSSGDNTFGAIFEGDGTMVSQSFSRTQTEIVLAFGLSVNLSRAVY